MGSFISNYNGNYNNNDHQSYLYGEDTHSQSNTSYPSSSYILNNLYTNTNKDMGIYNSNDVNNPDYGDIKNINMSNNNTAVTNFYNHGKSVSTASAMYPTSSSNLYDPPNFSSTQYSFSSRPQASSSSSSFSSSYATSTQAIDYRNNANNNHVHHSVSINVLGNNAALLLSSVS